MSDETNEAAVRAKILADFSKRWDPKEAERRIKLLEEAIPRLYDYAQLHNARADIKVHPEHLEMYVTYLQPRVRAVLEHCGPKVIDSITDSMTPDERLAKIIKCVNILDARARTKKDAGESE